ncbi:hypothetical protein ACRYCC_32225 [Actinomadura scrupuli]|uniref:hypothetical protein n=1 Tax=Actinomadura scrupuli TaxID=559629 RepID=UPI003D976CB6
MRAVSPLLTRILGYGGAVVLVAVAVTVVLLQLQAGVPDQSPAGASTSAGAPLAGRSPGAPGAPTAQGIPGGTAATPGPLGTPGPAGGAAGLPGSTRCGSAAASYQRAGDSLKVSVTVPATGLVAAFVEAKGRGTLTKSVTAGGERGPHVFEFTGVPAAITRRIGITVITPGGLQTCDLPLGG